MKDLAFVIALIVLIIVAMKILFWAVSKVLVVVLFAALVYIGFRIFLGRRRRE